MPESLTIKPGGSFLSRTPDETWAPEDFGPDERLMIAEAEAFSKKEVLPVVDRLDAQEDGLMPALIRRAGALGFCGIDAPEAYGGLGLGKNLAARILEFLSLNASFSVTVGITSGISQVGLILFGSDDQKRAYLPALTAGEAIGAYCLSEPNSGTDALSATTRAERVGGDYVLTGTKMWISNAKWADLFLVMAKVDGERFSAFLVPRDAPGLTVGREEHKMGLKGSSTARVVLEGARIPVANLLHEEGLGHQVAFNALNLGRFKLASMSIGPARDVIGHAAQYAQDRRQFGQPIAHFGLIQEKLARIAALFWAAESAIYRTGALIDGAFAGLESGRAAAEEHAIECSIVKVFATEAEATIIDDAVQIYGGYGFTEEFPIARHYRDARVSRIYEGTNEINRVALVGTLQKRMAQGRIGTEVVGDGFLSDLVRRGLALAPTDQVGIGALADLIILQYVAQSARAREARYPGGKMLSEWFRAHAYAQGAVAFQKLSGEAVTLPAIARPPIAEIAQRLCAGGLRAF